MSHQDMLQHFDFELRPYEMNGGLRFPATGSNTEPISLKPILPKDLNLTGQTAAT